MSNNYKPDKHIPEYLKVKRLKRKAMMKKVSSQQRRANLANDILDLIFIGVGLYGIFVPGAAIGAGSKFFCLLCAAFGWLDMKGSFDASCKECGAKHMGHKMNCSKGKIFHFKALKDKRIK